MNASRVWFLGSLALALFLDLPVAHGADIASAAASGKTIRGASVEPSISGDGRRVVFSSLAALVPEDQNGVSDIYVRDRETGELRRLSDERGGDQPLIAANGRFVVFRALDAFPKLRLADLESKEPPRTVSYPFGGGRSFRTADSAAISPDGRYVSFPFRPIPGFSGSSDPQLCVNDTFNDDRLNASTSITQDFLLNTLGRSAMTRDGFTFFMETADGASEGLAGFDTNGATDIYRVRDDGSTGFLRVSAAPGGEIGQVEDGGETPGKAARDPVVTPDGSTLFFISERQLRVADTDGRETIYRSTSADGFTIPVAIPTVVRPLALSRQATANGEYLAFLGQPARGAARPYLLRLSNGELTELAASGAGAPAISQDNSFITFASAAPLAPRDGNRAADVFIVPNPHVDTGISAPTVTLTAPADGTTIFEGNAVNLSATASWSGGVFFTAIEVNGREIVRSAGSSAQSLSHVLPRGVHTIRAVALNQASIVGVSNTVIIIVEPPSNTLGITGPTELTRETDPENGAVSFAATVRIDNNAAFARGALQLVISEAPTEARWEIFGNEDELPPRDEQVLETIELKALGGNATISADVASTTSPPETITDGFQGIGWTVRARLRELVNGAWVDRDTITLFEVRPRLDENTPGPNGGVPVLGTVNSDTGFNPALLQSLQIQGRGTIAERTRSQYRAMALFSNGSSQPANPRWSVEGNGVSASISAGGVLTVGDISAPKTVTLRAVLGGKTQSFSVTVKPVSPVVSVRAVSAFAAESNDSGAFRIVRSPPSNEGLTVRYEVSGKAFPGEDYTALSGTAVIPAGKGSVEVPVQPLDDGFFEGHETVTLRLLPSGEHRLSATRTATLTIEDDEPLPTGQPDASIRVGRKPPIGISVFDFDGALQQASARGTKNRTVTFTCDFVNRTAAEQSYTIEGSGDFLGFTVRYFDGSIDVTAAVVEGTYQFLSVAAGTGVQLTVKITPTSATPLRAEIRCPITVRSDGFLDVVEAAVRRVR